VSDRETILALERERRAAEALRDTLLKLPDMDEETTRDTIEGETDLHGAIAGVVALITDAEVMAEGLAAKIKQFEARLKRYEDRVGFLRAAVEQAMVIGEMPKLALPDCTLSLGRRTPGVVITNEALIPAEYWKPQDPALDKKALKEALKDKKDIPGATLGNGGVSLTIRRA
jgi:hypothetical protein